MFWGGKTDQRFRDEGFIPCFRHIAVCVTCRICSHLVSSPFTCHQTFSRAVQAQSLGERYTWSTASRATSYVWLRNTGGREHLMSKNPQSCRCTVEKRCLAGVPVKNRQALSGRTFGIWPYNLCRISHCAEWRVKPSLFAENLPACLCDGAGTNFVHFLCSCLPMCSVLRLWPSTACRTLFVVVLTVFLACVEFIWTQDLEVLKSSQKKNVLAADPIDSTTV